MTALYLTLSSKKQTNTLLSIHFRAVFPSMAVPIDAYGPVSGFPDRWFVYQCSDEETTLLLFERLTI